MDTLFALTRAVHFASLMGVFGAAALLVQAEPEESRRRLLMLAAVLALLTGAGLALFAPAGSSVLIAIARGTLLTTLVLLCLRGGLLLPKTILAGVALVLVSLESHAAKAGDAPLLHAAVDALHLLAAAYWVGGLAVLAGAVLRSPRDQPGLIRLLRRFSRWAAPAVAIVLAAGTANGFIILGTPGMRWTSGYIILLAIKIVLAGVMVALALTNRFGVLPGLERGDREAEETLPLTVIAELSCAVAILIIIGFMGVISPAQT